MEDIINKKDIELMVDTFYGEVMINPIIGPIFSDVVRVNWSIHLPKMYSFWGSLLLNEQSYSGHPIQVHADLSNLTAMTEVEFNEWLMLFHRTVDELFFGKKADEAKEKASNLARLMLEKIKINE
ncbi:MAG: group III truncated hemoglobin [Bacteroidia bacterium]|nr:group III truncated hemoglobin [Bacteroidia bacterium]